MRLFSPLLMGSVVALAWPVSAASPTAAAVQPWTNHVRCAALMERMPEMMDFTLRMMDAAALTNPAVNAQLPRLKETMQQARPVMLKAEAVMREQAKAQVSKSHAAWTAHAGGADRGLTADALFEREMGQARKAYADVRFETIDDSTTANMKRLQADLEKYCQPLSGG